MRCATLTQLPRRVLRRDHGELGARGLADALDAAAPAAIGVRVEANVDGLTDRDVRQVGLLVVRLDPHVVIGDDRS